MEKFIIQGGSKIKGSISVKGAKNHALKAFAASLLSEDKIKLTNVPEIQDIFRIVDVLELIGTDVRHLKHGTYQIDTSNITTTDLPHDIVPQLRASIVLVGPMLARFKKVSLPHPGGCAIGKRPIDIFISGLQALGAKFEEKKGLYSFHAPKGLQGTTYTFPKKSVTGTETLMMAATLAEGETILKNVACEPEITALAEYLNKNGAKIKGAGSSELIIKGVKKIKAGKCKIIPDRIEMLSFLFMALATNSKLEIQNSDSTMIENPLQMLKDAGAKFEITKKSIIVHTWKKLQPMQVSTDEYPGFPTDGQSPLTVLLTQINGESEIKENIYTDRLFYSDMLNRMGANITMHTPQHITIQGKTDLSGKNVESPDLRAGIAMVIAAIVAKGETQIANIYQIDRGYEEIDLRLKTIGVDIKRITS